MTNPPTFEARNVEVSRDGRAVLIEIRTPSGIGMVFSLEPQQALNVAHDLERAFHQRQEGKAAEVSGIRVQDGVKPHQ